MIVPLLSERFSFMTSIYVGNLPFSVSEDELRSLFEQHGEVQSVKLINDRETGRPRGFALSRWNPLRRRLPSST